MAAILVGYMDIFRNASFHFSPFPVAAGIF